MPLVSWCCSRSCRVSSTSVASPGPRQPGDAAVLALCLSSPGSRHVQVLFGFTGLLSFGHRSCRARRLPDGDRPHALEWGLWPRGLRRRMALRRPARPRRSESRGGRIAFAMVTLAFAQPGTCSSRITVRWTGGEEGTARLAEIRCVRASVLQHENSTAALGSLRWCSSCPPGGQLVARPRLAGRRENERASSDRLSPYPSSDRLRARRVLARWG